jgi:hypothetical protein
MNEFLIANGPTSGPIFVAEWVAAGLVVIAFGITVATRWWSSHRPTLPDQRFPIELASTRSGRGSIRTRRPKGREGWGRHRPDS